MIADPYRDSSGSLQNRPYNDNMKLLLEEKSGIPSWGDLMFEVLTAMRIAGFKDDRKGRMLALRDFLKAGVTPC